MGSNCGAGESTGMCHWGSMECLLPPTAKSSDNLDTGQAAALAGTNALQVNDKTTEQLFYNYEQKR